VAQGSLRIWEPSIEDRQLPLDANFIRKNKSMKRPSVFVIFDFRPATWSKNELVSNVEGNRIRDQELNNQKAEQNNAKP